MDWTIPNTFYPTALPSNFIWALFSLACIGTVVGTLVFIRLKSLRFGLLCAVPLAVVMLLSTMIFSMVLMFFIHDQ